MIVHFCRYLLYSVNYGEGFNLRRDVYIRMANLVRKLNEKSHDQYWTLVRCSYLLTKLFTHQWKIESVAIDWSAVENSIHLNLSMILKNYFI